MLHWTSAGAVAMPEMVQIRLSQRFSARVTAGAPVPTRTMTSEEFRAECHHFTIARRGPRTQPCHTLLLSGMPFEQADLAAVVADRALYGWRRVVVHLDRGQRQTFLQSAAFSAVDGVSLPVVTEPDLADLAAIRRAAKDVTAIVVLDTLGLSQLERTTALLEVARPQKVVLSWPFPSPESDPPPSADQVAPRLKDVVERLQAVGIGVGIKGLPACRLGSLHPLVWRSANRWYVDVDHRGDRALLFFPEVVRFVHPDECRFCAINHRCDGVPEAWWRIGRAGVLRAIESDTVAE